MKLLFAIKCMNIKGGAERVLADICNCLAARGHDVTILTFDMPGNPSFYPLAQAVKMQNLGIGNVHRPASFWETLRRMCATRRFVRDFKPDMTIGFMHSMFIPLALSLVKTGQPVIASEHIVPGYYRTRKMEFLFFLLASAFVNCITIPTRKVKDLYPRILSRKMVVVPNPVQPSTGAMANTTGIPGIRKVVLNVARLDVQKDQKTLIEAFARIAPDFPDWDLRILGDGPLRQELEAQVRFHNMQNRIQLPGTTQDIATEYQHAQLFALPSLFESFGLATAEAMLYALPVIGYADCPGTNELIIDHHNGLLLSGPDRVSAMANALQTLMKSPELRYTYGQNACKSIANTFHPETVAVTWESLIRQTKTEHDQNLAQVA